MKLKQAILAVIEGELSATQPAEIGFGERELG